MDSVRSKRPLILALIGLLLLAALVAAMFSSPAAKVTTMEEPIAAETLLK